MFNLIEHLDDNGHEDLALLLAILVIGGIVIGAVYVVGSYLYLLTPMIIDFVKHTVALIK